MNKKEKINDIIYKLQAFGLKCLAKFFYITGLRFSTIFSSFILMVFAPFTPPSFYAMRNMKMAMPELSFFKRFKILIGMWNNLGKDLAEFVFFHTRSYEEASKYINIDDESHENLLKIKESKLGELLFTAHFGNWELLSQVFIHYGLPISAIYRSMNNKYADDIVLKFRERYNIEMIPKGQKGVIRLAKSLKEGKKIYMLVDQRLSNGIEVPFFNIPSKTSNAVATFSLKYGYKIYSIVVFRKSFSSYFDLKVREFEPVKTGNLEEDIRLTSIKINETIEEWIRLKPEQWFWVHRRWKE